MDDGKKVSQRRRVRGAELAGHQKWEKPVQGLVKLNVDRAVDVQRELYGTCAVVRNEFGQCLGVLAVPGVGVVDPQSCEVMALYNGLHFCAQAGLTHVVVVGDAQNVITALDETQEDFSVDGSLLDAVQNLLQFFSVL